MDKHTGLETLFGASYAQGFIIALFDNKVDRDIAATALESAGFGDTRSLSPQEVLNRYSELDTQPLGMRSANEQALANYIEGARDGQSFLVVSVSEQRVKQASKTLFQHEAHGVTYYGDQVVTGLTKE